MMQAQEAIGRIKVSHFGSTPCMNELYEKASVCFGDVLLGSEESHLVHAS